MSAVILAGLGTGVGLMGIAVGLRRQRPSIHVLFQALDREIPTRPAGVARTWGLRVDRALGERLSESIVKRPSLRARLHPMVRLADTSLEALCSQIVISSLVGVALPIVCWGIVTVGGLRVSLAVPLWTALVCAVAGACLPLAVLSSQLKGRRRAARRGVGTFLDLVVLCLAGGMGIEGALHAAARISDDKVSGLLLRGLMLARDAGDPPWEALAQVGTELGVDELAELAAAVGLAGSQGARIRSTLAAKAASIRRHELADAEAEANSVTEKLFLPGVLMLIGFLLFIGYPAVARIASGL